MAAAAQLVTISALLGAGPIPGTWPSLLLAVAPAPLTAAAAFAPGPVNLLAAVAGIAVLAAGIAGQDPCRAVCRPGAGGAGRCRHQAVARANITRGRG